jgi:DNA-binding SARP family transcriptional activator
MTLRAPALRRLLAVFLCLAGRPTSATELAHIVCDGAPSPRASRTIQVYVHRLRKILGDSKRLANSPAGYQIRVERQELDALRFADLVDQARAARQRRELEPARMCFHQALGLWRGPPYADVGVGGVITDEIRRLEDQRLLAHQDYLEVELDLGQHARVIPELANLAYGHPYRERLRALLMLALHRAGRRAEALELFRTTRSMLTDQLGVEPGELLQQMHVAVLQGDRRLVVVPAADLDLAWGQAARSPTDVAH